MLALTILKPLILLASHDFKMLALISNAKCASSLVCQWFVASANNFRKVGTNVGYKSDNPTPLNRLLPSELGLYS